MINWESADLLNYIVWAKINGRDYEEEYREWLWYEIQVRDLCVPEREETTINVILETVEKGEIQVTSLQFLNHCECDEISTRLLEHSKFQYLYSLGFYYASFSQEQVIKVARFIQRSQLSVFELDCNSMTHIQLTTILQSFMYTPVDCLTLRFVNDMPQELVQLAGKSTMRQICLDGCNLQTQAIASFFDSLATNTYMEHLLLLNVHFSKNCLKALSGMLTRNRHLRHFTMYPQQGCVWKDWNRWLKGIAVGLQMNSTLERLHIPLDYDIPDILQSNINLLSIGQMNDDFDGLPWDGTRRNHGIEFERNDIAREALELSRKLIILDYPQELKELILENVIKESFPFDFKIMVQILLQKQLVGLCNKRQFTNRGLIRECYRLSLCT